MLREPANPCWRSRIRFAIAVLCLVIPHGLAAAGEQDVRAHVGVRLFRSVLLADLDLRKKTVEDGSLLLVFFASDPSRTRALVQELAGEGTTEPGRIKGLPVVIETTADPTFENYKERVPAGIFIAENPSGANLRSIIAYGVRNHVIVYSPFEGAVERGVPFGLSVEAQVKPYVNLATVEASRISLKSFFMKVTKVYQ